MIDLRKEIGAKVRDLRKARRWTQAELAQRLDLSQARLSEIERGNGSFAAEHLLEIFRLFNIDASYFAPARASREDQLWNASARLGAHHLVESEQVLPSERVQEVHDVLRDALVHSGSPRLISALAAVLVARANQVQLSLVENDLAKLGLQHRLGWLVENTLEALKLLIGATRDRAQLARYRRADVVLSSWLRLPRPAQAAIADLLDTDVRSEKTRAQLEHQRSPISARWGILSELRSEDFARAIEAAHGAN